MNNKEQCLVSRNPSVYSIVLAVGNTVEISFYSETVVHFRMIPAGGQPSRMWGISAQQKNILVSRTESETSVCFRTTKLSIQIDKKTGLPTIGSESSGQSLVLAQSLTLSPTTVSGEATHRLDAVFITSEDEAFYGMGQHQDGSLNLRGKTLRMWHDYKGENHEGEIIAMPLLISTKGYLFMLDNPSRVTTVCGVNGKTSWSAEVAETISFFVVVGDSADNLYAGYRLLTGETPLPPKSAIAYIQCKQRYKSQAELLDVAHEYRRRGYPCDMLVVDWFHWKRLGDLDLDREFWPDPAAMNRELHDMGYHVMISCWPRFMKESRHYATIESMGGFMKGPDGSTLYGTPEDQRGAVIDTTNPSIQKWYWNTIRDNYGKLGFDCYWLDENEPDVCPHGYHFQAGSGARIHNLYPLTHTQAVYNGHRRDCKDRCFILSRSAYFGAQQNGTTFWSSDIKPDWDTFRRQVPTGLNFCASGMAWWSSDIGGWQPIDPDNQELPTPVEYTELYIRWFQYGAFCPTFRAHGTRIVNEVWSYGIEAETILVKYLHLRYRLLPYIYSLAWNTRQTGAPFMRALFMDFPCDPQVHDIPDQYMFGQAFLVAPVTTQGATTRKVYLPSGACWYDFWTNQHYEGGQWIIADAHLETIPLFVRGGSVIPMGNAIQHTGQLQDIEEVRTYAGADGSFDLYCDDGTSYAYEQGEYRLHRLTCTEAIPELRIEPSFIQSAPARHVRIR